MEDKVEAKEEKKVEERKESEEISQEALLIDSANYLSEILEWDFNTAMDYVKRFPELTKEEMLMYSIESKE